MVLVVVLLLMLQVDSAKYLRISQNISVVRPTSEGTNNLSIHDPSGVVIEASSGFGFIFSSSYGEEGCIEIHRTAQPTTVANVLSPKTAWTPHAVAFGPSAFPSWFKERVPLPRDTTRTCWAPDISFHHGEWRLYYAVSSFGSQRSCIGLAVSASLLEPHWRDRGPAVCSELCAPINQPSPIACNAIDPHVLYTEAGKVGEEQAKAYMSFGSFWTGIKLVELNASTGLLPLSLPRDMDGLQGNKIYNIAENFRPDPPRPIEASWLEYDAQSQYFFLFVNWGFCCRGTNSTYEIRVGRARKVHGPFVDRAGVGLEKGGGSLLLGTQGSYVGPGQVGLLPWPQPDIGMDADELGSRGVGGRFIISMHYYSATDAGTPFLRLMEMQIYNGWPSLRRNDDRLSAQLDIGTTASR
eukprot:SAG31_NODE_1565_length_7868_cov_27.758914_7_plen_410_part_00